MRGSRFTHRSGVFRTGSSAVLGIPGSGTVGKRVVGSTLDSSLSFSLSLSVSEGDDSDVHSVGVVPHDELRESEGCDDEECVSEECELIVVEVALTNGSSSSI